MNLEPLRYIYLRRVVGTALGMVGFEAAQRVARYVARAVFNLSTPARHVAESHLAAALERWRENPFSHRLAADLNPRFTAVSPSAVIACMYDHVARFWIEALFAKRLLRYSTWRHCVKIENEAELQALAGSGHGSLLATAYFGNLAVGAYALGRIFRPVHVIVDAFTQSYLRAWQNELYTNRWVRPIEKSDAGRAVPRILAAGGAIMLVCEHERRRGRAVPTAFLGRNVNCYPTLDRLSHWFDAPVGVFTCRRTGEAPAEPRRRSFTFALSLHETVPPDAAASADGAVIRRVMRALELAIMMHPEQYLWSLPLLAEKVAVASGEPASHTAALGDGDLHAACVAASALRSMSN